MYKIKYAVRLNGFLSFPYISKSNTVWSKLWKKKEDGLHGKNHYGGNLDTKFNRADL